MANAGSETGNTGVGVSPAVRAAPLLAVVAFAIGCTLDFLQPLNAAIGSFSRQPRMIAAGTLMLLGGWFIRAANSAFRQANQGLRPWHESRALAIASIYATTRNPINQGFLILVLGLAVFVRSDWTALLLLPTTVVLHIAVLREERSLQERFGDEYRAYQERVPRYGLPFASTPMRALAVLVTAVLLVGWMIWGVWPRQVVWPFAGHQMTHRLGWSYAYVLPRPAFAPLVSVQSDTVDNPNQSEVRLFEDGVALGPPHSLQRSAVNGLGAYAHWGGAVVFSASDNSNPRTNRRAYEARGWIRPDLLNVALALLLIGAATNRLLAHMGRQIETSLRRL